MPAHLASPARDPLEPTRHFDTLRELLQLERQEERRRLVDEAATLSLTARVQRGLVELDLEVTDERTGIGGRIVLSLRAATGQALTGRMESGALVAVHPRRAPVKEPALAVVTRRRRDTLELAFDHPPPEYVQAGRVYVELRDSPATFERARGALDLAAKPRDGRARRKQALWLGAEAPRFRAISTPAAPHLNPAQNRAVGLAEAADDLFLLHGPPGTGKTTVLVEIMVRAIAQGQRVVVAAASNAAVDHLMERALARGVHGVRLGHPARVAEAVQAHTLEALAEQDPNWPIARDLWAEAWALRGYAARQRRQGRARERFANSRAAQRDASALVREARALEQQTLQAIVRDTPAVFATLTGLGGAQLRGQAFDLAVVDEATQATEPIALWALHRAERLVLAGDHRQLPPTVVSVEAARRGLGVSAFERLIETFPAASVRLDEQYRMHEAIMAYPSVSMYEGGLRAHPANARRRLEHLGELTPFVFLDTAGRGFAEREHEDTESRDNPGEAHLVAAHVQHLLSLGLDVAQLAVITPYLAQVRLLRELTSHLPDLDIDSVDAFQGREREAVLVSLVRSNDAGAIGFLADTRRTNVALTRAKAHLFVVGDSATLSGHPYYEALIAHAQATGAYQSVWEWPGVSGIDDV